jgi:hypothetical protein
LISRRTAVTEGLVGMGVGTVHTMKIKLIISILSGGEEGIRTLDTALDRITV